MQYLAAPAVFIVACVGALAGEPGMPSTVAPGAKLTELYAADAFFEGPVWHVPTGKLYFTLHKGKTNQVLRLDAPGKATVWMDNTEGIGGLFPAPEGRLLATQAYGHRLLSFGVGDNGPVDLKVLHHNKEWHQPNDLFRTPNGNIYFTDPDFKNQKTSAVYLYSPQPGGEGKVRKIIDDMAVTNGIIASPDGKTLYVGDSFRKHWRAYPIQADGTVGAGRLFFDPDTKNMASPDGMSIDEKGNVYCSGRGGVWVVAPDGAALGLIAVPTFISNVAIGGENGRTLFMVGSNKVYSLDLRVRGVQSPGL